LVDAVSWTLPIDPVDALVLDSSDARAEAQAQHGEGGEVDLGIAVALYLNRRLRSQAIHDLNAVNYCT